MCGGVDCIVITTNVIGGVVDSSCPKAVDCIVSNANVVSIFVRIRLMRVAIEVALKNSA